MQEIYLHFLADFPALLRVNEIELGLLECSTDTLSVQVLGNQQLMLSVFPVSENNVCASIPYIAKINIENNCPTSQSKYIEITNFECLNFEIKLLPMEVVIHKKQILIDSIKVCEDINVLIFDDGILSLEITTKNKVYKYPLSQRVYDYKFMFYIQNETQFLIFEAKTLKNQQFLLVFSNFFCNLEIVADFIERTKTQITALNYQCDIARHGVVQKFKLDENHFVLCDEYTVFVDNHPHRPTDPKLIPWAFAEAINLGDTNLARTYLETSLSTLLSDKQLLSFFGDYVEIKWNNYTCEENTLCFIYDGNPRISKTFRFEICGNKISNITQLD